MASKLPTVSDAPRTAAPPRSPEPPQPRRRRSFAWLWLLILVGLGYGAWRYQQATQQKQQAASAAQAKKLNQRPVSVVTAPVNVGDIPVILRGLGSVTAFNSVAVKSRVDGQLIGIHFTEGQFVKQGDLLAEIDPRPYQVQLEQAQGQLARDQAQLNDAKVNMARYEALWNEKVIAKQQLDTQAAQVGQFQGVIEADQATVNNAKLQLTYSKITAPISGRIGLRMVDVGNIVHAGDANGIVMIAQMEPISVLFTIPADNLPPVLDKLRAGAKLRVDAYDRDDRIKLTSGTLLTVDNQIDPTTGTSRLKAVFDNHDGKLFPNQFVNIHLLLDTRHNAILVPAAAIQRGPQGTFVYIVTADKKAAVRPVTLGTTEGDNIAVDKGLQQGEMIVIEGQDKLQDGTRVDVRTTENAPARRRRAK
jgi:multidrug efflux system membrane fusion protein